MTSAASTLPPSLNGKGFVVSIKGTNSAVVFDDDGVAIITMPAGEDNLAGSGSSDGGSFGNPDIDAPMKVVVSTPEGISSPAHR
jgi:hypothetical protein